MLAEKPANEISLDGGVAFMSREKIYCHGYRRCLVRYLAISILLSPMRFDTGDPHSFVSPVAAASAQL